MKRYVEVLLTSCPSLSVAYGCRARRAVTTAVIWSSRVDMACLFRLWTSSKQHQQPSYKAPTQHYISNKDLPYI